MKLNLFPLGPALCALAVASCSAGTADLQDAYLEEAEATMQAIYTF